MAKLGKATCVKIGRFQLKGKFKNIEIVNRKLLKMWPGVVNAPKDFDAYLEVLVLQVENNIPPAMWNATVWASQTSLRRWVGLYDEVFNTTDHAAQNWDEQKTEILKEFSDSVRGWMPKSYLDVRQENQSLRSLKPGDNEALLAWATELLSINIAAYYADTGLDDDGGVELRAAHWVETDGGLHIFRIMALHLMATRMGRTNAHYISHSVRAYCFRTAEVRETIERYPPRMLQKSVEDLTPDEHRQLFLLDVATRAPRTIFDDKYEQDLEVWSGEHLRRYLRANGLMKESDIQRATTKDMRQAMGYKSGLFEQRHIAARELGLGKARRNDEPDHEIDGHLYRPLAWEYGPLFADLVTSRSQPAEEMVRLVTGWHATNRTTGDDELPELLDTHGTTGGDRETVTVATTSRSCFEDHPATTGDRKHHVWSQVYV